MTPASTIPARPRFAPARLARLAPLSLLVLLLLLPGAPSWAQEEEPLRFAPDRLIDIEAIDLDLLVDLPGRRVEGSATISFKALADLERFELDAVDHQVMGVVALGGAEPRPLRYEYEDRRLGIALSLARGQSAAVRVDYRIVDPQDGLYFFGPSEDAPQVPWQLWSQGEPSSNRRWFPCLDHPDERQRTSLTAHVRPELSVISNGTFLGKTPRPDGLVTWRFEQKREHVAYLVTLVVGTFARIDAKPWRGKVPLTYYVPPGRKADAERSFARTGEMMDLFSRLSGVDYPWAKYEQVVVEQFVAGGMENTGATTLNERTLHDERAHLDYSSEGLVAHELAHQWFGDLLTCRDWAHIWLNESFATYFDALWVEHSRGPDEYTYELYLNSISGMNAGKQRPIVDRRYPSPDSVFDGRAYPKGSCVLHMLRRQLGEDAFWQGIRAYTSGFADRGVETHDLRRALEEASGRNLERFFTQWTERPGHPVLDVRLERDAERGLLTVTIEQRQPGEAYQFPAVLLFRFGQQEIRHVVPVAHKRERFVIPSLAAPSYFRFDPDEAVILKELTVHKGRSLWIEQLQGGNLVGRIRAAIHLGREGRPQGREALVKALANEPSWIVRKEVALALRGVGGSQVRDALLTAFADADPRVRRAAVETLGARGLDPVCAKALSERLSQGDPSYYVEAACVEALVKVSDSPRELLGQALARPSHNDVIRIAAINALRSLDEPELAPLFARYVGGTSPPRTRQTAARALSAAGLPGASPEALSSALDALRPLLRARDARLRRAALDALTGLGAGARPLLEEIRRLTTQDSEPENRTRAEAVLAKVAAGAPPQEQLERIRAQAADEERARRALEERIGKLEAELRALRRAAKERAATPGDEGDRKQF